MSQAQFDFSRGEQLALLRGLMLPATVTTPKGEAVSATTLKAVLRVIDDHARKRGECFATQQTIAREVGVKSVRTIKRAIAALSELNLITTVRKGHINHHRIVWGELQRRQWRSCRRSDGDIATTEGDMVTTEGDIGGTKKRSSQTRYKTPTEDGALKTDRDGQKEVLDLAERIAKATHIRVRDNPENQSLIVKVAMLYTQGQLCQADIEDAIEAVTFNRPQNPAAYFHRCLDNAVGGALNELLAGVTLGKAAAR